MRAVNVDPGDGGEAVFEFFARRLPGCRNFLLAAGLEQLLDVLGTLTFDAGELEWLDARGYADRKLLEYLRGFRFTGDVIHYASKAARSVLAAPGRLLVDFGMRRAHGAEAAFEAFAHSFPGNVVLLIDTYDTLRGARKVAELVPKLRESGTEVQSVRIDSGELASLSKQVRDVLDSNGAREVRVFASGSLNEYEIERLIREAAPIDGFGVGTELDISADAPYLDCAYKLQEYEGQARRKRSAGKATWPGRKQIFRTGGADGRHAGDTIGLAAEIDRAVL